MAFALLGAWLAVQVTIAWVPFRLDPPGPVDNGAHYLDDGALTFSGDPARAVADPPLRWNEVDSLVVDLTVRTQRPEQHGPARILTVAHDYRTANLVVGQEGTGLVVRVRYGKDTGVRRHEVEIPRVFERSGWQRVRVRIGDSVDVTVNDQPAVVGNLSDETFAVWDPDYPISMGDEVIGGRPWAGTVQQARLTAAGQAHDLIAPGALDVPDRFLYIPARLRDAMQAPDTRAVLTSVVHFLAWVPAGAVLAMRLPSRRRLTRAAAAAGGLALALQVGKLVIAGRHPSVLDMAAQTTGALAGAVLATMLSRRHHRAGRPASS